MNMRVEIYLPLVTRTQFHSKIMEFLVEVINKCLSRRYSTVLMCLCTVITFDSTCYALNKKAHSLFPFSCLYLRNFHFGEFQYLK